ncbi:aspartyl protease 25-like [Aegilops tauschii subsp. strangulata]
MQWTIHAQRVRFLSHPPQRCARERRAHNETVAFADNAEVHGVVIGCAHTTTGFHNHEVLAGVLGLGKQRPSLIWTRLHQHGHDGRFSYCLFGPRHPNRHGFLRFGADVPATGHMRSTKILYMCMTDPEFSPYHVGLTGVSVVSIAGLPLSMPHGRIKELFQRHKLHDGRWSDGCVIDPGTGMTVMIKPAYDLLVHAVEERVRRLGLPKVERDQYPVCFRGATRAVFEHLPTVTLHLDDDLVLQPQQLFVLVHQDACLTVMPSEHITIIGAMQQVNTRFVYDIAAGRIHFAHEDCHGDMGGQN